jgi:hypothetical protein
LPYRTHKLFDVAYYRKFRSKYSLFLSPIYTEVEAKVEALCDKFPMYPNL